MSLFVGILNTCTVPYHIVDYAAVSFWGKQQTIRALPIF